MRTSVALIALAIVIMASAAPCLAQERLTVATLLGLWNGKMMNPQGSVLGIVTTVTFREETGAIVGSATFKNYDLNVEATGTVDQVDIRGDTLTFRILFRGGAPGVDGTYGHYTFRVLTPGRLEGDGRRERSHVSWSMEKVMASK